MADSDDVISTTTATGSSDLGAGEIHMQMEYMTIMNDFRAGTLFKQVNVLVLGAKGSGKSSLINSLRMCINKKGFDDICQLQSDEILTEHNILQDIYEKPDTFAVFPKVFEFHGISQYNGDDTLKLLRLFLLGHVKQAARVADISINRLKPDKTKRINGVILVQAVTDDIPFEIFENIKRSVTSLWSEQLKFPFLIVNTKIDELDKKTADLKINQIKQEFDPILELAKDRGYLISSSLYTTDSSSRQGDIDKNACKIWNKILRTEFKYPPPKSIWNTFKH